jgi:D-3-phosphoglycerate dehydrogenase / 2-oxoglutarate reductase
LTERVVLVTDYTWPSVEPEAAVLAAAGARLLVAETGEEAELVELVAGADAILTCFKHVSPAVVRAGGRLQVIGRYGIGVDNIAVEEATRLGIPVTNVPGYCAHEVAEHVLALILAHERGIARFDQGVRNGDWTLTQGLPMRRVAGRALGIVGFGRIGQALARKAAALELDLLVHDPSASSDELGAVGARAVALQELAADSDYVSVHVPLTDATRGLVGGEFLRLMKPTAFLVNAARGGIVDQAALLEALREGRIAGAGIDVFEPEQLPPGHPLLEQASLIATPHVAFYSEESVLELEVKAAENVAAILEGRRPEHVVNPEVLELERWAHLR